MGATNVVIYNYTNLILNLALSQVGPLYYENYVKPGEKMERNVGKAWFAVEGRVWNGQNNYSDKEIAVPIITFTSIAIGGAITGSSIGVMGGVIGGAIGGLVAVGTIEVFEDLLQCRMLIDGRATKSYGWYFDRDERICTTEGPEGALSPRIVGGRDAPIDKYPYQAALRIYDTYICGGSILNNRTILTSAHCVYDKMGVLPFVKVHVGTNFQNETGDVYEISNVTINENYNATLLVNDIALLHIEPPIRFTEKVQPIKLATNNTNLENKTCTLSGWGNTKLGGGTPNNLQEINLTIYSQTRCKAIYSGLTNNHICTLTKAGEGTCHFDYGSPLVCNGTQVGIVTLNWGRFCGIGYPDVYTRVSNFLPWINKNLD